MKAWVMPVVLIFAFAALVCGALLMPVAELLPATINSGSWEPGLSPVRSYSAMQEVHKVGNGLTEFFFPQEPTVKDAMTKDMHDGISGEVRSYVLYSVFLSLAMILAAIAINAVGRWDSEEKTIIPYKK
jgi:hypothetical protein